MLKRYQQFLWWLNLENPSDIKDNELQVAQNVYYNEKNQLQTRRWYRKFSDQTGSAPFTSVFYWETDELVRHCIWFAWGNRYAYDETNDTRGSAIATWRMEFEPFTWRTTNRVRADFAVYKGVAYIADGVNPYQQSDGTTAWFIWATWPNTCTFDNTTDKVSDTAHWLADGDEIYFTNSGWALPAEITTLKVYYVANAGTDDFQIVEQLWWVVVDFTDNGTWTSSRWKLLQPRVRYVQYLQDRIFAGWAENAPTTVYYTDALDTDGTDINNNFVVVWWDEEGRITWLSEFVKSVLVFKDSKIYALTVTDSWDSVDKIDAQWGWHCDRAIASVGNSLVYFSDRWLDTLVRRTGVDGAGAVDSLPISSKINKLFRQVAERQYGAWAGWYIQSLNNYYFAFDTNDDNVPDKVVVFNSKIWVRTEYVFPPIYDFGRYKTSDWVFKHLFTSGSGGQVYQFEYWYDDDGQKIDSIIQTKDDNFGDEASEKTFWEVYLSGYKQEWGVIDVSIIVDGDEVGYGQVTDTNINISQQAGVIGIQPIGTDTIWASVEDGDDLPIYAFSVKIPLYYRWKSVSVKCEASGVQWILDSMKIQVDEEVKDLFPYSNIL